MPDNKQNKVVQTASNEALNEIEQLRLLVFGQAKAELDRKIENVEQSFSSQLSDMTTQVSAQFSELSSSMSKQFADLASRIDNTDSTLDANKVEFTDLTKGLSSQLEMAENASKDDSDIIHKRIDDEVNKLETTVNKSMQEILAQFESVTKELTSSKTDRKTLAQLLANMASNLDADN